MEEQVKQVIVVRNDLPIKKAKLISQIVKASLKFILENNTSSRNDKLFVELTQAEAEWTLDENNKLIILSVDSEDKLNDLIFKANLRGVEVHFIADDNNLICAAFGPDKIDVINDITGNLKLLN